jgi:RND family efflux transporter MFP subunit
MKNTDKQTIKINSTVLCLLMVLSPTLLMATEHAQLDCMVKPEMYVELSSPVNGVIETLLVEKGTYIKKGQPLALLESSVEKAKVQLAKLQANSYNDIKNKRAQLKFALRNKKRLENMTKQTVSLSEKDKVETEATIAGIEFKKASENKRIAQLNLALEESRLELKTIKSPIDGIVIDQYLSIGESVKDRPLMKLAKIDPLRVELIAPTEYFGLINKDMQVEIRPERPANKTFKATVSGVDKLIDPASGSFTVRMTVPNPSDQLVGGVNCLAKFGFETPMPTISLHM